MRNFHPISGRFPRRKHPPAAERIALPPGAPSSDGYCVSGPEEVAPSFVEARLRVRQMIAALYEAGSLSGSAGAAVDLIIESWLGQWKVDAEEHLRRALRAHDSLEQQSLHNLARLGKAVEAMRDDLAREEQLLRRAWTELTGETLAAATSPTMPAPVPVRVEPLTLSRDGFARQPAVSPAAPRPAAAPPEPATPDSEEFPGLPARAAGEADGERPHLHRIEGGNS